MLIQIKRYIKEHDTIVDILLNTNYIVSITPVEYPEIPYIKTRIIMPGFSVQEVQIIYCCYSVATIKSSITKGRNKGQEIEE